MEIKNNMNRLEQHLNRMQVEKSQERLVAEKASAAPATGDTVQMKSPGLKAAIEQAAQGSPDIREDRVAAIKASIADGTYKIDNKAIAGKLLNMEQELYQ